MYRMLTLVAAALLLVVTSACNHNDCLKTDSTAAEQHAAVAAHASSHQAAVAHQSAEQAKSEVSHAVAPVTSETAEAAPAQSVEQQQPVSYSTHILYVALPAKYGNVVVPHTTHTNLFSCDTCHSAMPPGKISLDKRGYHNLCRKCHKEMQAGPTRCRGCHTRNK